MDYYIVTYTGIAELGIQPGPENVSATKDSLVTTKVYHGLRPNSEFQFSVVGWKNSKPSPVTVGIFTTKEDRKFL